MRRRDRVWPVKTFADGIERAGADVPVDNAERRERDGEEITASVRVPVGVIQRVRSSLFLLPQKHGWRAVCERR
jgi:hypothetical protein